MLIQQCYSQSQHLRGRNTSLGWYGCEEKRLSTATRSAFHPLNKHFELNFHDDDDCISCLARCSERNMVRKGGRNVADRRSAQLRSERTVDSLRIPHARHLPSWSVCIHRTSARNSLRTTEELAAVAFDNGCTVVYEGGTVVRKEFRSPHEDNGLTEFYGEDGKVPCTPRYVSIRFPNSFLTRRFTWIGHVWSASSLRVIGCLQCSQAVIEMAIASSTARLRIRLRNVEE